MQFFYNQNVQYTYNYYEYTERIISTLSCKKSNNRLFYVSLLQIMPKQRTKKNDDDDDYDKDDNNYGYFLRIETSGSAMINKFSEL